MAIARFAPASLQPFTASDGENLAVYDWPLESGARRRGTVLLVHGLGEHAGRYGHVARQLNAWGFAVRAYDQYGHGQSGGPRGGLNHPQRLIEDLADLVDATRKRMPAGEPLIVLGHSLGGLVVARFASLRLRPVDGVVLSSPALNAGLSGFQQFLVRTLVRVAPQLRVGNGLDVQALSHDPAVVADYQSDPLNHDRIGARLGQFLAEAGPATLAAAPAWQVPTLLLWAGADRLVRPAGSEAFAAAAPPAVVEAQAFPTLYHEIFNELDAAPVFARLGQWLDRRFP